MGTGNDHRRHADTMVRGYRIAAICLLVTAIVLAGTGCSVRSGHTYRANPAADLNDAVARLEPGDTLLLEPGTYAQTLAISDLHGTAGSYITIAAASTTDTNQPAEGSAVGGSAIRGGTAVLNGSRLTGESAADDAAGSGPTMITLDHCSYLRISGLTIAGAHGRDACGISVRPGCHHLVIEHNELRDIRVSDTDADAKAGAGAATDSDDEGPSANGILLLGDSAQEDIHDVTISANTLRDCDTGWSECISVAGHVSRVAVEGNTIDDTGNIGIDFSGNYGYCPDPALDRPVDCTATGNTVRGCRSPIATSYGLYVDGAQHIVLSDNTVTSCGGGIEVGAEQPQARASYATRDIRVEGNTVSGCDGAALAVGGYERSRGWVRDVYITGNTCTDNARQTDGAIVALSKCQGVRITGNTFHNASGAQVLRYELGHDLARDITFEGNVAESD